MNNFFNELMNYFETTSQEKILIDWSRSEKFDEVGPSIHDFLTNSQYYHVFSKEPLKGFLQDNLNPKYTSGFFIN